jgi:hypothetical protein
MTELQLKIPWILNSSRSFFIYLFLKRLMNNYVSYIFYYNLCSRMGNKTLDHISGEMHKVFFWLLLQDRLNTRGLLKKAHASWIIHVWALPVAKGEAKTLVSWLPLCKKNCWGIIRIQVPSWMRPQRTVRRIKRSLKVSFAMEIIIIMC